MTQPEILVGVTGGIAAYKAAYLVSQLVQDGAQVSVIMTGAAHEFIGAATFAALTGRPVGTETFDLNRPLGAHIDLGRPADLLCVVPATANFLAKAAQGIADDLLSTAYLVFDGPVVMAPAMNAEMWNKPAVQRNVQQLTADGVTMVAPGSGWLSCRVQGVGRMAEPDEILAVIKNSLPNDD